MRHQAPAHNQYHLNRIISLFARIFCLHIICFLCKTPLSTITHYAIPQQLLFLCSSFHTFFSACLILRETYWLPWRAHANVDLRIVPAFRLSVKKKWPLKEEECLLVLLYHLIAYLGKSDGGLRSHYRWQNTLASCDTRQWWYRLDMYCCIVCTIYISVYIVERISLAHQAWRWWLKSYRCEHEAHCSAASVLI